MIPVPTQDYVVVEPIEREKLTESGIHLPVDPHFIENIPNKGRVVRVGPGRILKNGTHVKMELKVGDKIIFSKMTGSEIRHNGTTWLIVPERDVLAVEVE